MRGYYKYKLKRSPLERLDERASNHVSKFQFENQTVGSRNQHIVSLIEKS